MNLLERKWTLRYGSAAVLIAVAIIAVSLLANTSLLPSSTPSPAASAATFTVMLTDPPTVPAGTTVLNLTYSDVSLHVTYPNGTVAWLPVSASGTVDLFSLVNTTQTLASVTIPINSTVDKLTFTIAGVAAVVNGETFNVTTLSNTLVINVENGNVNQTLSGVLLDFNPTLTQIQATDADGNLVNYYVLVPSANAIIVNDVTHNQLRVGTIVKLGENNRVTIERVRQQLSNNLTISSALLSVNDNVTTLSVTLQNNGDLPFRVLGLTLNGDFNATRTWDGVAWDMHHRMGGMGGFGMGMYKITIEPIHPDTLPFAVNGTSLIPLFGAGPMPGPMPGPMQPRDLSALILQPGDSTTLTFSGIITLQPGFNNNENPAMVITPTVGNNYTLSLAGEGFETFSLTATS